MTMTSRCECLGIIDLLKNCFLSSTTRFELIFQVSHVRLQLIFCSGIYQLLHLTIALVFTSFKFDLLLILLGLCREIGMIPRRPL